MKQFIRDYFTFNKQERNGIIVLLFIIFSLLITKFIINKASPEVTQVDFTEFEMAVKEFEAAKSNTSMVADLNTTEQFTEPELFIFNPNNLPEEDWLRLGLTEKQIRVIKNYEAKGGKFYKKSDLKKMYCISAQQYLGLEPYINIPSQGITLKEAADNDSPKNPKSESNLLVELNTADSTQLMSIKGIGSFYAAQIVKKRKELGGFYSKQQLLELWKFDEKKLKSIEEHISIDGSIIKKININICKANELKHPYLSWTQVNGIINFRNKHGHYKSLEELKNTDLIDETTLTKISPYLTIDKNAGTKN